MSRFEGDWFGGCAEAVCLSKALNDGADLEGATISVVNLGDKFGAHGGWKDFCVSCNPMVRDFGLTPVK